MKLQKDRLYVLFCSEGTALYVQWIKGNTALIRGRSFAVSDLNRVSFDNTVLEGPTSLPYLTDRRTSFVVL